MGLKMLGRTALEFAVAKKWAPAQGARRRLALWLAGLVLLAGCTGSPGASAPPAVADPGAVAPAPPAAADPGAGAPAPPAAADPGAGAPARPAAADPGAVAPARPAAADPGASPVTWQITHTPSGLRAPGGPLHLTGPYEFVLEFSAPVDQDSVAAALAKNLCCGRLDLEWAGDRRLAVTVAHPTATADQLAVDPTGGRDRAGRLLRPEPERAHYAGFYFTPAPPTALFAVDPATGAAVTVATYPQPYQTISLSPDRRRGLLRQHILFPGQSVGVTGTAHLYDLATGQVMDLGARGLFRGEWSRDGGLLVLGLCPGGQCVIWAPPGGAGRLLYANAPDEYIASAHLAPTGQSAAVFAGRWGEPLSLHLFDLSPGADGRQSATVPRAAGVTQGPSGLTWVPAAWSPDGSALAYGDGGTRREESQPMRAWLVTAGGGTPQLLAEGALAIGPWRPAGDQLVLGGVGVVDRRGRVALAAGEGRDGAWSPDGSLLVLNGRVYHTATWQARWDAGGGGPAVWAPDGGALVIANRGLYRAGGAPVVENLQWNATLPAPLFSPDGKLAYLPDPDRIVDLATGQVRPLPMPAPPVPNLGSYRPVAFRADGMLLVALGAGFE